MSEEQDKPNSPKERLGNTVDLLSFLRGRVARQRRYSGPISRRIMAENLGSLSRIRGYDQSSSKIREIGRKMIEKNKNALDKLKESGD